MIIDAHIHSGDFLGRNWDAKKLIKIMDKYQVDRALISSEEAIIYGNPTANEDLRDNFIKPYIDRFIGYCVPDPFNNPGDEVKKCINSGFFKGIKLHPWYHRCPLSSSNYDSVFEIANKERLPVLVHSGGTLNLPDFQYALPEMFLNIARKYKDLALIIGHMGLERWREVSELVIGYENIYLDITMSMPDKARLEFAAGKIGSERILLGTDMPLIDPGISIGLVYGSSLSTNEKENILGFNMLRILKN
jgi:uncharacterized protein